VPPVLELRAQPGEVLDDAVVHDRDLAGLVGVRVGVAVVGRAVGRPPGMPDARPAVRQRLLGQAIGEVYQFARALFDHQLVLRQHRHPGRVIAAVLQAA
jgi:hypothetical protein